MIKQEDTKRHDNMHIQYEDCGHICTETVHINTQIDRQTYTLFLFLSHAHLHTYSNIHTQKQSLEIWCHIFASTLERVNAVLSAELLEILWDGVCGSEKSGVMTQAQKLKAKPG